MDFVLDCSVAMAWRFGDEDNGYASGVLESLVDKHALVPRIWKLEVMNVLLVAERRGRQKEAESEEFLSLLKALPIVEDDERLDDAASVRIMSIGRRYGLSSYDSAYLELAIRKGAPLATLDSNLKNAMKEAGVDLHN